MHPMRTPIHVEADSQGYLEVNGAIPPLEKWECVRKDSLGAVPRGAGCYALYRKGSLVYIGESDNLQERLGGHTVLFDEAAWLRLDGAQRLFVEKILIWWFMPPDNHELKRHDYRMKIKEEVLNNAKVRS